MIVLYVNLNNSGSKWNPLFLIVWKNKFSGLAINSATSPAVLPSWDTAVLFLLYWLCLKSLQSYLTLGDLMDGSPPGSSVQGILQTRITEWVAMPSTRGSSPPRFQTWVSCIAGRFFTIWATREAPYLVIRGKLIFTQCRPFRARPTHSSSNS